MGCEREAIVTFDAITAEFCSRQIRHTHIPVGTLTSLRCIFSFVGCERGALVTECCHLIVRLCRNLFVMTSF